MENDLHCPNLDDLDRSIIELMKVNGRITYKEVSDRLNIPEATACSTATWCSFGRGLTPTRWEYPRPPS